MATDSTSGSKASARPSSSTSELFGGTYARGDVARQVADEAWLQAMLDVEAALGGPALRAADFDMAQLGRDGAEHVSAAVPLAQRFAETHAGATSQDVIDTAMMLVAKRALVPLLGDASAAADAAAALAAAHRTTAVMGRTLLQDALPTSLGLRFAGWAAAIDAAVLALRAIPLPVQMGGPVGHRDPTVAAAVAQRLELGELPLPWHTNRVPVVRLATALGVLAGALSKPARDVTLMTEVREGLPGRGASSAMEHKRNPVAAISALACTRRVPGLVATMLGSMESELERAAGAWQAEWGTMTELLRLTGSAAAWSRDLLEHLEVDAPPLEGDLGASSQLIERLLGARSGPTSSTD